MPKEKETENSVEILTGELPLLVLRGVCVMPQIETRFEVAREKSINAIELAVKTNGLVFLALQKNNDIELPTSDEIYTFGIIAKVRRVLRLPSEHQHVVCRGVCRARIKKIKTDSACYMCQYETSMDTDEYPVSAESMALIRTVEGLFSEYKSEHQKHPGDIFTGFASGKGPGYAADFVATQMELDVSEIQKLISLNDPVKRLNLVMSFLVRENEISKLEDKINEKLKGRISRIQREQYLKEQIRTIQEELGQDDNLQDEADEWKRKLAQLGLADALRIKIEKEIDRTVKMPPYSPDVAVARNYIEWILELPWNKRSSSRIDLARAKEVLDEDHYGMEKIKDRILEYLAVTALTNEQKAPILCLVGPPGVGKTSIARSVARSIGREFVHMSLGGVRDEAEIRGHRRTYIGAIPGRVMTLIRDCGQSDPVFLFDEVDKVGADYHGDPAAALLEVLDPEQNSEFTDHYLEVPFDLSHVMFITTANTTDTIPRPLLDRMEILELDGYTREEKKNIAMKYLVPKQLEANGLSRKNISFSETAIYELIDYYTRESGVRGLEKEISGICRKAARMIVEGGDAKHSITARSTERYLGKRKYHYDKLLGKNEIGVAVGMAWTVVGGETLFVETAILNGSGQVQLTGQLGDVMQESARAAISYTRSVADKLGIQSDFYKTKDIHIHVPEGAVPKDGPSAGVTIFTSLVSALTGRPVRKDVAMTGEISLRGKVLPVGGIKEKVLAAHRMGIKKVLIPEDNKKDIDEIMQTVKDDIEFVLIRNASDALKEALL